MIEKSDDITPTENFEFAALRKAENYRAALAQEFSPFLNGSVVEVGAGIAHLSSTLAGLPSIEQLLAVESEVRFCNTFRRLHPELTLIEGTFDKLPADSEWDAIVSVNVLEHIREDDAELAKYRKSLVARRGHLCLFVPARQEIYAPLDKDFGHYRRYARKEILRKLEQTGYVIVRLSYFNFFGYFAWWFNFCVL